MDKIRGGWTGKSYGCMMGEPMEFAAQGEIYEGSLAIQPEAPTRKSGGRVEDGASTITTQPYGFDGEREVSFADFRFSDVFKVGDPALKRHGEWRHDPAWMKKHELIFSSTPGDSIETSFAGSCVYMQANLHSDCGIVDVYIDGELVQSRDLYIDPQWNNCIQSTAVWVTGMEDTRHTLKAVVSGRKNDASGGIGIALGRVVSYRGEVAALPD